MGPASNRPHPGTADVPVRPPEDQTDPGELTPEERRELRRRIRDLENPVRYVLFSDILPGRCWRLFLDVSDDTFCNDLDTASLFKRKQIALAVASAWAEGPDRDLLIAKSTIRGGKRKVSQYERRPQKA